MEKTAKYVPYEDLECLTLHGMRVFPGSEQRIENTRFLVGRTKARFTAETLSSVSAVEETSLTIS